MTLPASLIVTAHVWSSAPQELQLMNFSWHQSVPPPSATDREPLGSNFQATCRLIPEAAPWDEKNRLSMLKFRMFADVGFQAEPPAERYVGPVQTDRSGPGRKS